jgi:hypothetical protein
MIWWIVGAVVLTGLVVLAVVARGSMRRLAVLERAMAGLEARKAEVDEIGGRVAAMQQSLALLATRSERTREQVAVIKAYRTK